MQQAPPYREQSRIFLTQAFDELEKGDLPQASEKGWGAAAEIVKAIGHQRGWEHHYHRALLLIVNRLVSETNDIELENLFFNASALHQNFYEDYLSSTAVERVLERVQRFVEKAELLLNTEDA